MERVSASASSASTWWSSADSSRFEAGVYLVFAIDIVPWTRPIRSGRSLIAARFRRGRKTRRPDVCRLQLRHQDL